MTKTPSFPQISDEQIQCRLSFGSMYQQWMDQNSFSQQDLHDLSLTFGLTGPWNSQASLLTRGYLDCKPQLFVSLAELNKLIADSSELWSDMHLQIESKRLRKKFHAADAIWDDDSTLMGASDFFAVFVGDKPVPTAYVPAAELQPSEIIRFIAKQAMTELTSEERDVLIKVIQN